MSRLTFPAIVLGLIATWFLAMDSDYRDSADTALQQEQRDYMQAIQTCHQAFGPSTAPEYTDDNRLVCIGRKGQRHGEVKVAKQ